MLVIVVESASLSDAPLPQEPGGRLRTVHLPLGPDLPEEVVSEVLRSNETQCLVVGDQRQTEVVRRVTGFARQALWGSRVTGWAAPASPLRLAVALARLEAFERAAPLPAGGHGIALQEIVRQTHGIVAAASAGRLRPVRPTLLQRATFARGGGLYLVPDRPSVTSVWVLRPQTAALPPYLRLPVLAGGWAATVAAGPDGPDVTHLLELLGADPAAVTPLDGRAAWSARWGAAATAEVVLQPAAAGLLEQRVRAAVARSWSCTWCDAKVTGGESCSVCGAGTPATEPARQRRRPAAALSGL